LIHDSILHPLAFSAFFSDRISQFYLASGCDPPTFVFPVAGILGMCQHT
jgi:hypothetical protein